jgi:UDPglucose 6-dehydrogenase
MKITITGTGYVGLVTGACLAETGHHITCYDIDKDKISLLNKGNSPIYEPGLEELLKRNIENGHLSFTAEPHEAYSDAECIFIAVGTPSNEDGTANLVYLEQAAIRIAEFIHKDIVIVIKSTVPVGTNERIGRLIQEWSTKDLNINMVSNPEFLRTTMKQERLSRTFMNHFICQSSIQIYAVRK